MIAESLGVNRVGFGKHMLGNFNSYLIDVALNCWKETKETFLGYVPKGCPCGGLKDARRESMCSSLQVSPVPVSYFRPFTRQNGYPDRSAGRGLAGSVRQRGGRPVPNDQAAVRQGPRPRQRPDEKPPHHQVLQVGQRVHVASGAGHGSHGVLRPRGGVD